MSVDREQLKATVRRVLEAELGAGSSPAGTSPEAANSAEESAAERNTAAIATPPSEILTESDLQQQLRKAGHVIVTSESRLTPLAQEWFEQHRKNLTLKVEPAAEVPKPTHVDQPTHANRPAHVEKPGELNSIAPAPRPLPGAGDAIAIGSDHGGFAIKQALIEHLQTRGFRIDDCGTYNTQACDYPDFARAVAQRVAAKDCAVGIAIDGAGFGSAMVANKVCGVRAAHCRAPLEAQHSRDHNHANLLTLGAGNLTPQNAQEIVDRFLSTPYGGGRHARRVGLIETAPHRSRIEAR